MNILLAPDSFKNSLSAKDVCKNLEIGIKGKNPKIKITKVPLADGGEGTVESIISAIGGKRFTEFVLDPLQKRIKASYGIFADNKTVVIEMATASGLTLLPISEQNPCNTTTYGTGELIRKVIEKGYKNIILGLGDSATTDGGAGALQALGVDLLDKDEKNITLGGLHLKELKKIELKDKVDKYKDINLKILYDVENPLIGENGTSKVYAKQKGANKKEIKLLEKNLKNFAALVKKNLNLDISTFKGSGAAGGLGAGLSILFNTSFVSGSQYIINNTKLISKIDDADIVVTGEGELNSQTKFGKIPLKVAKIAKEKNKKVIGIFGKVNAKEEYAEYFDQIISLSAEKISIKESMQNAKKLLIKSIGSIDLSF